MRFATEPTPDQLSALNYGAKLASLEPEMEDFVERSMQQTMQRMFTAIQSGELTPEKAIQGWHELNASYRMLQKYRQTIKVGQSTGQDLTKEK